MASSATDEPVSLPIVSTDESSWELRDKLADEGYLCVNPPERYGGGLGIWREMILDHVGEHPLGLPRSY